MAGKLVDLMFLKTNSALEVLERMVDDLVYFEFEEFNKVFLLALKKELPKVLELIKSIDYRDSESHC